MKIRLGKTKFQGGEYMFRTVRRNILHRGSLGENLFFNSLESIHFEAWRTIARRVPLSNSW